MHRALAALVVLVLTAVLGASSLAAQQVPSQPSNPNGPVQQALPCYEDCGGGGDTQAPTVELLAPGSQVTVQYPTITIQFCDNVALDGSTRQIKVNGVDRTSLFNYVTPGFSECAVGEERQSTTAAVALNVGSNTVWAFICDTSDHCTSNQWTIERLAGAAPVVSLAPYSADLQDYARCAVACFAATYAQSTVPYFSLDTPRNVTLVYNGDRVDPKPFVHVDVTPGGTTLPQHFQLRLRKSNGTYVTFLNGESTLRFSAAVGTWRLGGQFDPASNGMGADSVHSVTVVVGAQYSGGLVETSVATRVIVLNENDSPIARGWTLAGIQRLYPQAGGSALIAEGEGSATYFQKVASLFNSPAGDFSRLTVAGTGSGTVYTRAYPDSTKVRFNYLGYMTAVTDAFGNRDSIQYDGNNRLYRIIDPNGTYQQLTYNANGLNSIAALGRTTTITVQANRTLTAITDPDNVATQFGYDTGLRLLNVTDRNGVTISTLAYHATSGKVTMDSGPWIPLVGGSAVPPVTRYAPWQLIGVPYAATQSPASPATAARADTVRAVVTDAGGHATRFAANAFGQPLMTTGVLNDTVSVLYTATGLPDSVMPNMGVRSGYDFNSSGLPTRVTVGGLTTNIAYSYQPGMIPSQTSGDAQPTVTQTYVTSPTFRYLTSSVAGAQSGYRRLDVRGRDSVLTDPEGHLRLQRWYNGTNGNVSKDSAAGGRVRIYGYDTYGRRTWDSIPEFARRNVLTYDAVNRVMQVRDTANAAPTVYGYDGLYMRAVTDPAGNRDSTFYNALGWPIAHRDALGKRDSVWYDVEGQVRRTRGRLGAADTVAYTYDAGHRLRARRGALIAADTLTYSADGLVTSASNANARVTTYASGIRRQVDSVATWLEIPGQGSVHYVHRYAYRGSGLAISLLDSAYAVGPSGLAFASRRFGYNTTRYSLDSLWFGGALTRLTSDDDYMVPTVTLPGGETISTDIMNSHSSGSITSQVIPDDDYGFDRRGRIVEHRTGALASTTQGYDRLDRLTSRAFEGAGTCNIDPEFGSFCYAVDDSVHTHGYDVLGNRTSSRGQVRDSAGNFPETWSITGTYTTGNRIATFAGCSYAHDDAGNRIRQVCGVDSTRYYWNGDGQLTSFKRSGGDSVAFAYDPLWRVVRRTVNGVVASNFLWEGDNLHAELTATGMARLGEYSYYGTDQLHAFIPRALSGYGTAYAHQDAPGNVRGLSTGAHATLRTYQYDEFGTLTGGTSAYPGEAYDRARWKGALSLGAEANLYYMRNRWYDTRTGRFLSEDPIGLAGGLNLYAFAGGDPMNGLDPMGLDDCREGEAPGSDGECEPVMPGVTGTGTPTCAVGLRMTNGVCTLPQGWEHNSCDGGPGNRPSQCDDHDLGSGDDPAQLAPEGPSCWSEAGRLGLALAVDGLTFGLGKYAKAAGRVASRARNSMFVGQHVGDLGWAQSYHAAANSAARRQGTAHLRGRVVEGAGAVLAVDEAFGRRALASLRTVAELAPIPWVSSVFALGDLGSCLLRD